MYSSELDPAGSTGVPDGAGDGVSLAAVAEPPISLDAPRSNRGFLNELAQAMQAAAERERERMSTEVDGVAEAHVDKVRTRGAAEAEELRKLAEDDITGIHAWTKAETVRIREEAERRIGVRRSELDGYLVRHTALIDGEVGQIGGAVEDYHHQIDAFFDRLSAEANPAEFARLADDLPEPPDLAKVGADARAAAVAELAREEEAPEPIDRGSGRRSRPGRRRRRAAARRLRSGCPRTRARPGDGRGAGDPRPMPRPRPTLRRRWPMRPPCRKARSPPSRCRSRPSSRPWPARRRRPRRRPRQRPRRSRPRPRP